MQYLHLGYLDPQHSILFYIVSSELEDAYLLEFLRLTLVFDCPLIWLDGWYIHVALLVWVFRKESVKEQSFKLVLGWQSPAQVDVL